MSTMVELRTLSCSAKGIAQQYDHPITLEEVDEMSSRAGFGQYIVIARGGPKCGETLTSKAFPYDGNVDIVAYNAAKVE